VIADVMARIGAIEARIASLRPPVPFPDLLPPARTDGPAEAPADPPTTTAAALPAEAHRWRPAIFRAARAAGIDPALLTAVVWTESGFKADAVSPAGAIGLAQLMPGTADQLGVNPYDPYQNLEGGARFLRTMIDRFGRLDLALAAYNAGPARVARLYSGGPGVPIAQDYVATVIDHYRTLGGSR